MAHEFTQRLNGFGRRGTLSSEPTGVDAHAQPVMATSNRFQDLCNAFFGRVLQTRPTRLAVLKQCGPGRNRCGWRRPGWPAWHRDRYSGGKLRWWLALRPPK